LTILGFELRASFLLAYQAGLTLTLEPLHHAYTSCTMKPLSSTWLAAYLTESGQLMSFLEFDQDVRWKSETGAGLSGWRRAPSELKPISSAPCVA
jgi:hypothetical protein